MKKLRNATLLLLGLASCASPTVGTSTRATDARAEIASYCGRTPIRFSEKLDTSAARDIAISKKFGSVCLELSRQDGLDFGEGLSAYECRVHFPRMSSAFVTQKFEHEGWWNDADPQDAANYIARLRKEEDDFKRVFGMPLSLELFDPATQEANELIEQAYDKEKKNTSDSRNQKKRGIPLAYMAAQEGLIATIFILSDTTTANQKFLISREELSRSMKGVRSLAGAVSLLYLLNLTGISMDAPDEDRDKSDFGSPICNASSIASHASDWTIRGIEIHRTCQSPVDRDIRVDRSGTITVEKSDETGHSTTCFD